MKNTDDIEYGTRERDREIVSFIDFSIIFICFLGYDSCIVMACIPDITGNDDLSVLAVFSWFLSAILSFYISKYFPGLSSYQIFAEFSQAIFVLILLYYASAAALLILLNITEPPRLAAVFSVSLMFLTAIIKSANKPK